MNTSTTKGTHCPFSPYVHYIVLKFTLPWHPLQHSDRWPVTLLGAFWPTVWCYRPFDRWPATGHSCCNGSGPPPRWKHHQLAHCQALLAPSAGLHLPSSPPPLASIHLHTKDRGSHRLDTWMWIRSVSRLCDSLQPQTARREEGRRFWTCCSPRPNRQAERSPS